MVPKQRVLFCWMFAAYALHSVTLFSHLWLSANPGLTMLGGWLLFGSACVVFLAPAKEPWFLIMAASWALFQWSQFPGLVNHEMVTLLVCTSFVLLSISVAPFGRRTVPQAFPAFAPVARWCLLILYFFVTFHKLNTDFFDPSVSCGWIMYEDISQWTRVFPAWQWLEMPMIVGVIAMEGGLPVLLVFPKTRALAIALGTIFHASLALHTNIFVGDFSLMMMAYYVLFIPEEALERGFERVQRLLARFGLAPHLPRLKWGGLAAGIGFLLVLRLAVGDGVPFGSRVLEYHQFANRAYFWLITACYFAFTSMCWLDIKRPFPGETGQLQVPRRVGALVIPCMVVWGFLPYFGFHTDATFAMFSNVRFEEGSNHWFMPQSLRLARYGNDIVEIEDSSDPKLVGKRRPRLYWKKWLSQHRDPELWVEIAGTSGTDRLDRGESPTPDLFQPVPWYLRWMHFRPPPAPSGPAACQH